MNIIKRYRNDPLFHGGTEGMGLVIEFPESSNSQV
jgi:hypothetical protein